MSLSTDRHPRSPWSIRIGIDPLLKQKLVLERLARGEAFARVEGEDILEEVQSERNPFLVLLAGVVGTMVGV